MAFTSLISITAFLVLRKLHLLRVDKAIEEIGFDVAELGNVSENFLEAVREDMKLKSNKKYLDSLPDHYNEEDDEKDAKTEGDGEKDDEHHDYAHPGNELKGEAFIF